jgi:hypothetical protein
LVSWLGKVNMGRRRVIISNANVLFHPRLLGLLLNSLRHPSGEGAEAIGRNLLAPVVAEEGALAVSTREGMEARAVAPEMMSTHASVFVDSVGLPSAEVCRAAASFP